MTARPNSDRGIVSGFVTVLVVALVACAGLVFDGARLVAAHDEVVDEAEGAARAGAQMITSIRSGRVALDPAAAEAAAHRFLVADGYSGDVVVAGGHVVVTVHARVGMTLLAVVGVGSKQVGATRSAAPVQGEDRP